MAQCLTQESGWANDNVSGLPVSEIEGDLSVYLSAIVYEGCTFGWFQAGLVPGWHRGGLSQVLADGPRWTVR